MIETLYCFATNYKRNKLQSSETYRGTSAASQAPDIQLWWYSRLSSHQSALSFLLLTTTGSTHLPQHGGHLFSLSLGTQVRAQFPLGHLESALVLSNLQELSDPLLVRSKPCHLADELAHERGALAELALGAGRPLGDFALRHLVTPVHAYGDAVAHNGGRHRCQISAPPLACREASACKKSVSIAKP